MPWAFDETHLADRNQILVLKRSQWVRSQQWVGCSSDPTWVWEPGFHRSTWARGEAIGVSPLLIRSTY